MHHHLLLLGTGFSSNMETQTYTVRNLICGTKSAQVALSRYLKLSLKCGFVLRILQADLPKCIKMEV